MMEVCFTLVKSYPYKSLNFNHNLPHLTNPIIMIMNFTIIMKMTLIIHVDLDNLNTLKYLINVNAINNLVLLLLYIKNCENLLSYGL